MYSFMTNITINEIKRVCVDCEAKKGRIFEQLRNVPILSQHMLANKTYFFETLLTFAFK